MMTHGRGNMVEGSRYPVGTMVGVREGDVDVLGVVRPARTVMVMVVVVRTVVCWATLSDVVVMAVRAIMVRVVAMTRMVMRRWD